MSISVYTQYMENYGVEESANYWKFKWGSKYIVEGTDDRPANAVALVTNHIAKYNSNTNYAIEYVHRWIHTDEEEAEIDYTVLQYNPYFSNYNIVAPTA